MQCAGFTSERSAETASHPHGTANSQNICVTIRVLLTQKTERGNKRDERDNEGGEAGDDEGEGR